MVARIDLAKTIRRVTLDGSRRTVKQVKSSCHSIHTTVGERDPLCQLIGTLRQSRSMTITEAQSGAEKSIKDCKNVINVYKTGMADPDETFEQKEQKSRRAPSKTGSTGAKVESKTKMSVRGNTGNGRVDH